jgi:hypothetical protein
VVVLLALGTGAGVYAYTKHVEVKYLTQRADDLERRITQLQASAATSTQGYVDPRLAEIDRWRMENGLPPLESTTSSVPTPTTALIPEEVNAPEPTPDLMFERMKREQIAQDLKAEVPGIAYQLAPNANGSYLHWLQTGILEGFVPVYMVSTCLDGTEPSAEGFRQMVATGVVKDSSGNFRTNLESLAMQLIERIDEKGKEQNPVADFCLQPYLYPESIADAAPAVDLYLSVTNMNLPLHLRERYASVINGQGAEWFNEPEPRQPFLTWLCTWANSNPCGL